MRPRRSEWVPAGGGCSIKSCGVIEESRYQMALAPYPTQSMTYPTLRPLGHGDELPTTRRRSAYDRYSTGVMFRCML